MNTFESLTEPEETLLSKWYSSCPITISSKVLAQSIRFLTKVTQQRSDDLEITSGLSFALPLSNHFESKLKIKKSSKGLSTLLFSLSQSKELYTTTALIQHQVTQHGLHLRHEPQISLSFLSQKGSFEVHLKNNPLIMNMSLTSNYQNFHFGGALNLAMYSQKYTEYALAVSKTAENYKLLAKHSTSELGFGTFYLSYYLKLGQFTKLASIVTSNWHSKVTGIKVGFEYDGEVNRYKGKVDSGGHLGILVSRRVSELFLVSVCVDFDLKEMSSSKVGDYSLGVLVNFNYEA